MDTVIHIMNQMIDFHTHVLFGVDDGPKTINQAFEMLYEMKQQGISHVVLTPHVNIKNFDKKDIQERNFHLLEEMAKHLEIKLYLGAEIYLPFKFPALPFENFTIGNKHVLLLEFSPLIDTPIFDHVYNLKHQGYQVVIAHIERYRYLTYDDYSDLKSIGALFQVNSSSLFKSPFNRFYKIVRQLLKDRLIDIVASDSHNLTNRVPNLDKAFQIIKKNVSLEYAKKITYDIPLLLLE